MISKVIEEFSTDKILKISSAYSDGGLESLFPRLERAALNQIESGDAIFSRYAIWANTVRDTIVEAIKMINESSNCKEVRPLLIRAANSLSAFSEIQALFDPERK